MRSRNLLNLVWLIPAYLLFLQVHQINVFLDAKNTMANGELQEAEVTDFKIKQIAAQTNGYIVVRFTSSEGELIERKLSLGVQHAARLMEHENLPVRYLKGSGQEVILVPTFDIQLQIIRINIAIITASLIVLIAVSAGVSRYVIRKNKSGEPDSPEFKLINT
ncbi:MAG: hypothetical protein EA364_01480 [Balneolaceae bacterium]|nr:MAG: hypothetical protein EA364_01480 [Balneolaceae bacterium]